MFLSRIRNCGSKFHRVQDIGHVQHTDIQINGNNIDNINTNHKTDQKHRLKHAQKRRKHKTTFNIREPIQPRTGSKKLYVALSQTKGM